MTCNCPYLPCPLRGNCTACIAKNRQDNTLCNCMESVAQELGASLKFNYPSTVLCDDSNQVATATAAQILAVIKAKPTALICLPAGDSAKETFALLAAMATNKTADFTKVRFVQLDEWLDLDDESENCTAFLQNNFYSPAKILPQQIMSFDIHADNMDAECKRMDKWIAENGPIDLMLLGLGMNGHLGLNEPNIDWDNHAHVVQLSDTTKTVGQKYFTNAMPLTRGITLGIRYVYEAKCVVLQVFGEKKAEIVKQIYSTAPTMKLPGSVMQLIGHGIVVLDKAAASLLDLQLLKHAQDKANSII